MKRIEIAEGKTKWNVEMFIGDKSTAFIKIKLLEYLELHYGKKVKLILEVQDD